MEYYLYLFIRYLKEKQLWASCDVYYFYMLKIIKDNLNGIWRQLYSNRIISWINIQSLDVNIDVSLLQSDIDSWFSWFESLQNNHDTLPLDIIESIQIKNFRWFLQYWENDLWCLFDFKKENHDIYKNIILYAPNGSWKSSFCEALEYILTWDIKERHKRWQSINDYLDNKEPEIIINDNPSLVISDFNKEKYKKCFIEKNRITEFSVFSKESNEDKRKLISNLLWLDDLKDFYHKFHLSADTFRNNINFLDQEKEKLKAFITQHQNIISKIEIKNKEEQESLRILIELGVADDKSIKIRPLEDIEKKIQEISIQDKLKDQNGFERIKINSDLKKIQNEITDFQKRKQEKSKEINFAKLYESILFSKQFWDGNCPACDTPIDKTVNNPFEKAEQSIKEIANLWKIDEEIGRLEKELIKKKSEYDNRITVCKDNISFLKEVWKIIELKDDFWNIDEYVELLSITKKEWLKEDKQKLIDLRDKISFQFENYKSIVKSINALESEIIDYSKNLKLLTEANLIEEKQNLFRQIIWNTYPLLLSNLTDFYNELTIQEVETLKESITQYYKLINNHDSDCEIIDSIEIVVQNDDIEIYITKGEERENALCRLSEWHLRALWLSIRRAYMKKYNVPFMLFDDVVNAIDSDHRSNIIDLLSNDEFLSTRQLIITTHDRLMWERYCNVISESNLKSFILKYNTELWGVYYEDYTLNYENKINLAISKYDIRQSLIYIRIRFESVIFNYLKKKGAEIKGTLRKDSIKLNIYPSLESLYDLFASSNYIQQEPDWSNISQQYQTIRDRILSLNRNMINQEWHELSDTSYNPSIAITSTEILGIKNAMVTFASFMYEKWYRC